MKNIIKKVAIVATLMVSVTAKAQLVIPATYLEGSITTGGIFSTAPSYGPTIYNNSATIDYTPFCSGGPCSMIANPQLTAFVADGDPGLSLNPPMLYLNDQTMSSWIAVPIPAPAGCHPDVVLANDVTSPGDFLVGVIVNAGVSVRLFTYRISGATLGVGALTATLASGIPLGIATANTIPHIDIIGEYSTPLAGLATANKFAATWESAAGVMGCFGNMGMPTTATPPMVINSFGGTPDVAAVERYNSSTGAFEDWALFTYIDWSASPQKLLYQEWCMSPMLPPSAPILYDNTELYYVSGSSASLYSVARIDANDDYMNNTPGTGLATFVISAPVTLPLTVEVFEYNDLMGPGPGINITGGLTPITLEKKVLPTVVFGPASNYTIGFYSYGGAGGTETYNSIAIDWTTGMPTGSGDAYTMNWKPYFGSVSGISHAASCNNDMPGQQQLFAAWLNYDDAFYKYSSTAAPYAYKHQSATPAAAAVAKDWTISPNPASEFVTLSAPSDFDVNSKATYQVMDMTGKTIIKHAVTGTNEQININNLPSGMYMININSQKDGKKEIKFVKD